MAASEKMLAEIHAMIQALRPAPTVLRPEPALASVSAAFGSAAQNGCCFRLGACPSCCTRAIVLPGGVRPPKCAHPPLPDRRVPYKSSIMHVVWISVSTYVYVTVRSLRDCGGLFVVYSAISFRQTSDLLSVSE